MKALVVFLLSILICAQSYGIEISGGVQKEDFLRKNNLNIVVDGVTGEPVPSAKVTIPQKGVRILTDDNGYFDLSQSLTAPVILSVEADGYRPFSMTLDKNSNKNPLILGITKQSKNEIVIDSELHHLGDDNFSYDSANAGDFRQKANGASFSKVFSTSNLNTKGKVYLKIGSVIGLDTSLAKQLNQNRIRFSTSTPLGIYINSRKIGEVKINGDNQVLSFAGNLLNSSGYNEITLETGINQSQHRYVDYDDMEFMHLIIELQ